MNDNEKQFENFVRGINFDDTPGHNHRDKLEQDLLAALARQTRQKETPLKIWRTIMKTNIAKLATAAVLVIIVLSTLSLWPGGISEDGKWWLGPKAAWGQEIISALEKVEVLTYREQPVLVGTYGSTHISGTWRRYYEAKDRSRTDQYYEDTLVSTGWNLPDGEDLLRYDVSFEYQCYTIHRDEAGAYESDPVERLRFYVSLLDKADRTLPVKTFEGRECVGFEISASKYGTNPEDWIDRIWFDVETRLPVRIEKHGLPVTNHPEESLTHIQDQFEYYVELPLDMFTPRIPEGFVNTHPDNVRAAREKKEKGQMIFAEVPPGLKEEIFTALNEIKTVVYRQHSDEIYLSRYAWRKDSYNNNDQLLKTEWYVIEKEDMGKASFDFNEENFLLIQTTVDFENETYKVLTYGPEFRPRHPMDNIRFPMGYIDRADRILENTEIEGTECFGFEISAKKYGTNPDGMLHRLWFDTDTKLPVRMEFEWWQNNGTKKSSLIRDRFKWNPELPGDTFTSKIPEGFALIEPNEP